ncbi:hypothetical protein BpHYR1_050799 [Brachionus plicatilis]|uniref:SWIM-type domain-containing protein n=1 Tax=Brachionus plicatilis TaxID=10195 RepID=A0A3M7T7I1_BRAPC|nr:hypothetical protein BpHYR1_050799 [Brachionus plicatilis]
MLKRLKMLEKNAFGRPLKFYLSKQTAFMKLKSTQWKLSRCSCDWNSKNYICKHVIGVCSKLKIADCQIPIASVNKPLGKKRSRGRPTLAAAALVVDPTGFKKA